MSKFSGQLYQLYSKVPLKSGDYVKVNSPFDTYGVVLKTDITEDKKFLNLIRGVEPRLIDKPVYQF